MDKFDCVEWISKFKILPGREHQFFLILDPVLKQACSRAENDPSIGKVFSKIMSVLKALCVSKNTLFSSKFRLCLGILGKFIATRAIEDDNGDVSLWLTPADIPSSHNTIDEQLAPFFRGILDSREYNELPKSVIESICLEAKNFIISPEHTLEWCVEFLHFLVQNVYDGYVYDFL